MGWFQPGFGEYWFV
nr:hypothetical protein [Mycobacterium marinum]